MGGWMGRWGGWLAGWVGGREACRWLTQDNTWTLIQANPYTHAALPTAPSARHNAHCDGSTVNDTKRHCGWPQFLWVFPVALGSGRRARAQGDTPHAPFKHGRDTFFILEHTPRPGRRARAQGDAHGIQPLRCFEESPLTQTWLQNYNLTNFIKFNSK